MDLDDCFGGLVRPRYLNSCERQFRPSTLMRLDRSTAGMLRRIAATDPARWPLPQLLFHQVPILWLVDRVGEIYFALEEVVDGSSGHVLYPKPRNADVVTNGGKLGHPSLAGGQVEARIAGEMFFDPGPGFACWVLTNQSGRYGVNCGRTSTQLDNVAAVFDDFGVAVTPYFIG